MKKGWTFIEMIAVIGIVGAIASVLLPLHTRRIRLGRTQMITQQIEQIYWCAVQENKSSMTDPTIQNLVSSGLIKLVNNMFGYPYTLSYDNYIITITTDVPQNEVSPDFPPEITKTPDGNLWEISYSNNLPYGNSQTEMYNWFFVGQRS
jgi:type II secretory pathway pseudopilin PulG